MGVKLKKKGGKWYVFVNYHGRRKAKCIGTKQAAEKVKRVLEAKLALGDLGFFKASSEVPTFSDYADKWLKQNADTEWKPSTYRSYEQLLRLHVKPRFGHKRVSEIRREEIKQFMADLSRATRVVNEETGDTAPKFSRNTLRLIVCALRAVFTAAVEDELIESNPGAGVGRFAKSDKPARQAAAMTRAEVESFLTGVREVCPEWFPFFLTAVRAGLRRGELIALKFGDIQFGESENDSNRYILVQRNYVCGRFTTPKNRKTRRVDLSRELRATLLKLRDERMLSAFMAGKTSVADELVFPCSTWDDEEKVWHHGRGSEPIKPDNIATRYMQPALEKAGLRHFRLHDLRHTFGSLLIQDGASLVYVKEQMGHSSIQITVDTYGHLVPGADISWVDRLDSKTTPQQSATQAQPGRGESEQDGVEVLERIWLPPRDSNPDMLIQSQLSYH